GSRRRGPSRRRGARRRRRAHRASVPWRRYEQPPPEGPLALPAGLRPRADLAVEHPALPRFLGPRPLVEPDLEPVELALQLLVARVPAAVELAASEGPPDRAARLAAMGAVGEPAPRGERLDVRERL